MKLFALIAVVLYCAVSLFMAVRLMLLAKRTRELPELMLGLAFLAGGMIGYPFNIAARVLAEASQPGAAEVAYVMGQVGMVTGAFFLLLAWRRIFVPTGLPALVFVLGWTTFMVVMLAAVLRANEPGSGAHLMSPTYWGLLIAQGSCYGILGWASFRHARVLERRSAIGLADPVIANRLFLWAMATTAITISYIYAVIAGVLLRNGLPNFYYPAVVAGLGLISALCVAMAFFPPLAYLERIKARSAMGGA